MKTIFEVFNDYINDKIVELHRRYNGDIFGNTSTEDKIKIYRTALKVFGYSQDERLETYQKHYENAFDESDDEDYEEDDYEEDDDDEIYKPDLQKERDENDLKFHALKFLNHTKLNIPFFKINDNNYSKGIYKNVTMAMYFADFEIPKYIRLY